MRLASFFILITACLLLDVPHVQARNASEPLLENLIHSDLPLFGDATPDTWPRANSSGNEVGCASRISFGDWAFRGAADKNDDDIEWYRISNYGVFHCWAVVGKAYQRENLMAVEGRPSFFVLLGTERVANRVLELWTLQMGARPGSDYLLLARAPKSEGTIDTFDVLQTGCPKGRMRRGRSIDILLVDYCAINSRLELMRLARRMAALPALGTLTHVNSSEDAPL